MPNIWSCNPQWFDDLKDKEGKVVVATWSERGGDSLNQFLEKLQALEASGTPVYVIDCDSCGGIATQLGVKEPGEAIVFEQGKEKGRLFNPAGNIDESIARVGEMVKEVE